MYRTENPGILDRYQVVPQMEINIIKKQIGEWPAIIYKDVKSGSYTFTFDGIGGAIITEGNYKQAKQKFTEAMQLAGAIKKLSIFRKNYYNEKL